MKNIIILMLLLLPTIAMADCFTPVNNEVIVTADTTCSYADEFYNATFYIRDGVIVDLTSFNLYMNFSTRSIFNNGTLRLDVLSNIFDGYYSIPHFCRLDAEPYLYNISNVDPAYRNYTVTYEVCDGEFNVTDWRENNKSIAYNWPFDLEWPDFKKDYSLYNVNFTITGDAPQYWTTGCLKGRCVLFDGATNYMATGSEVDIKDDITQNDWMINIWIKPESTSEMRVLTLGSVYIYAGNPAGSITVSDGIYSVTSNGGLEQSSWNMITVYNNVSTGQWELYINGSLMNNGDGATPSHAVALTLGKKPIGFPFLFNGYLDELHIYNRSMTNKQLRNMYESGRRNVSIQTLVVKNQISCNENWSVAITPSSAGFDGITKYSNTLWLRCLAPQFVLYEPPNGYSFVVNQTDFNISITDQDLPDTMPKLYIDNAEVLTMGPGQGLYNYTGSVNRTLLGLSSGSHTWDAYVCRYGQCAWSTNGNYTFTISGLMSSNSSNATNFIDGEIYLSSSVHKRDTIIWLILCGIIIVGTGTALLIDKWAEKKEVDI